MISALCSIGFTNNNKEFSNSFQIKQSLFILID